MCYTAKSLADVEVCLIQKRGENIRFTVVFCLKCLISYTRYGRSGRAAFGWPLYSAEMTLIGVSISIAKKLPMNISL